MLARRKIGIILYSLLVIGLVTDHFILSSRFHKALQISSLTPAHTGIANKIQPASEKLHASFLSVSPDGTRMVVWWKMKSDRNEQYYPIMYEIPSGKRLSPSTLFTGNREYCFPGYLSWAQDSSRMAYITEMFQLFMIDRDGNNVAIIPEMKLNNFYWPPEHSGDIILSVIGDGENYSALYNIAEKRLMRIKNCGNNLSAINGKTVYVDGDRKNIYLRELFSGKRILRIPLYEYADWDDINVWMSRDGKYIFYQGVLSANVFFALARSQDAGRVLHDKHLAIYWQEDTVAFDRIGFRWLWPDDKSINKLQKKYMIIGEQVVDITTGSRGDRFEVLLTNQITSIDYWYGHDDYVLITEKGIMSINEYLNNINNISNNILTPWIPESITEKELKNR